MFLAAVAAVLALPATALAQAAILDDAADSLRSDPVYVHPEADRLDADAAGRLRAEIRARARGPLFIAVLPEAARQEAGGSSTDVALELGRRLRIGGGCALVG